MNKREILLYTIGLPFVFVWALLFAVLILLYGDPLEEEDCQEVKKK